MSFFDNPNPKISRFNTRRGIFFITAVNSFMVQHRKQCFNMFKVTLFIYLCVWKRGGMIFFSPRWGGHAILSSRDRGGNIFFLTPRRCLPPPPLR